jgi:hypothetical protein
MKIISFNLQIFPSTVKKIFMRSWLTILCLTISISTFSQAISKLVSGPWAGNVELRNATIWAEVAPSVKSIAVKYYPLKSKGKSKIIAYHGL